MTHAGSREGRQVNCLLITTDFPPVRGGIQTTLRSLCACSTRLAVTTVAPSTPGASAYDRGHSLAVRRSKLGGRRPATHLMGLLLVGAVAARRRRPDVVLAGHVVAAPVAAALARSVGAPWLAVVYGAEIAAGWGRRIGRWCLPHAARVLAISDATRHVALRLGVRSDRCSVFQLGVDPKELQSAQLPSRWPLDGSPVLLTVARLDQARKGHDVVIRALPRILREVPTAKYVIVGEGRLRGALEERAARSGVLDSCVFTGAVSDAELSALYQQADVFVMPSRRGADGSYEGFGLVYLEANAHGVPVVAGRTGGAQDAVVDGETGLLVNEHDPDEVAGATIRLLTDDNLRERMGRNGRARVERELTWPLVTRRVEDAILATIAAR